MLRLTATRAILMIMVMVTMMMMTMAATMRAAEEEKEEQQDKELEEELELPEQQDDDRDVDTDVNMDAATTMMAMANTAVVRWASSSVAPCYSEKLPMLVGTYVHVQSYIHSYIQFNAKVYRAIQIGPAALLPSTHRAGNRGLLSG
jgi:anaerobic C4-dicarboxylate transporter